MESRRSYTAVVLLPRSKGLMVVNFRCGVSDLNTQGSSHGAALRIMLSMHAFRVYSSAPIYSSHSDAKTACAKSAIDEGVLDYLKRGNGHFPPSNPTGDDHVRTSSVQVFPPPISLQNFYESLPKPFPEPVGGKTASEINGPAWLNTTIQTARGGRLKATFLWLMDGSAGCKLSTALFGFKHNLIGQCMVAFSG